MQIGSSPYADLRPTLIKCPVAPRSDGFKFVYLDSA
jgi:hypothetical protein